jgi:hypothetical protein
MKGCTALIAYSGITESERPRWRHKEPHLRKLPAIGVLDGTVADLVSRFSVDENSGGRIQPGSTRPAFALVRVFRCPTSTSGGQTSDWLTLGCLLG